MAKKVLIISLATGTNPLIGLDQKYPSVELHFHTTKESLKEKLDKFTKENRLDYILLDEALSRPPALSNLISTTIMQYKMSTQFILLNQKLPITNTIVKTKQGDVSLKDFLQEHC